MIEKDIIERFFQRASTDQSIIKSIGDDAAILRATPDTELVVTTDSMVEGRHFILNSPAHAVAYKLMAVNVSDLAAMGATPRWATLNLTLPSIDEDWLNDFSCGLFACARRYSIALVGGDLTSGEQLNMSIQAIGERSLGTACLRSSAQLHDAIYISGEIGHAAAALTKLSQAEFDHAVLSDSEMCALYYPVAQVELGESLSQLAHACIDISDGLLSELEIICAQSQLGAEINLDQIKHHPDLDILDAIVKGDDYQLLFTADLENHGQIMQLAEQYHLPIRRIGHMSHAGKLQLKLNGIDVALPSTHGYQHFI